MSCCVISVVSRKWMKHYFWFIFIVPTSFVPPGAFIDLGFFNSIKNLSGFPFKFSDHFLFHRTFESWWTEKFRQTRKMFTQCMFLFQNSGNCSYIQFPHLCCDKVNIWISSQPKGWNELHIYAMKFLNIFLYSIMRTYKKQNVRFLIWSFSEKVGSTFLSIISYQQQHLEWTGIPSMIAV